MNNNDWLAIDVLEDYLDGKLDDKAMHRVERLSLEDPFVAEALAGLSQSPKRLQSLSILQKQLQIRIAQKPVEEKRWQITSHRLSIAAAAAVLFVTVSLLFWMRESSRREKIAANAPKKIEVAIATQQNAQKSNVKAKPEIEEIITEGKKNSYASRKTTQARITTLIELPSSSVVSSLAKNRLATAPILPTAVNGIVYGEDKLPISGASVKLKGADAATLTNSKGQFSVPLDSVVKDAKLTVTSLGFMSKEVSAKSDQNLSIVLKQSDATLNEVVITGYGAAKRASPTSAKSILSISAEPIGGWDKFEDYILNNNRLLVDKKITGKSVIVRFDFDKEGIPFNIEIDKTVNPAPKVTKEEESEAIRLIKIGPKWFLTSNGNFPLRKASVEIRF